MVNLAILHTCVQCTKLRGKEEIPLMDNLPTDRLDPTTPITNFDLKLSEVKSSFADLIEEPTLPVQQMAS